MKYKVIGRLAVGGVQPGGIVELDPDVTNIEMLIKCRHVEEIPTEAPKPAVTVEGGE